MKKLLIPVCLLFAACSVNESATQSPKYVTLRKFNGDTAGYIRVNFKENKDRYIGKELGILLKDLQVPVKSYLFAPVPHKDSVHSISLSFYSRNESERRSDGPEEVVNVIPIFQTMLPLKEMLTLARKNKTEWTKEEQRYFEHVIIKDVVIYHKKKKAS